MDCGLKFSFMASSTTAAEFKLTEDKPASPVSRHGCKPASPDSRHGCEPASPDSRHGCEPASPDSRHGCEPASSDPQHGCECDFLGIRCFPAFLILN